MRRSCGLWPGGVARKRPRAAAAEKCVPCGRVAVPGAARPPRVAPPPLCVYVRHTARRRLWVCSLRGG